MILIAFSLENAPLYPVPPAKANCTGLEVLFPTGSACQRKCWLTAAWVLLL